MSRTQRLLELMMTIRAKKTFTARELAEEFNVSYRTILRDLDELSALGVPFYSQVGAGGGYHMLNDRMLPPLFFTESEAVAMFFAYQSLEYYDSLPFEAEIRSALKKFYQHAPEDVKKKIDDMNNRVIFWNPKRSQPAAYLPLIMEASIERSLLLIQYDGPRGVAERIIQPIGLYAYNGFWYCPAYCMKREAFRLFRTDRICSAEKTEGESKRVLPYSSVKEWIERFASGGSDRIPFVVELTREGVRRAKSDLDLGPMVKLRADGTGRIEGSIPKTELAYFTDLVWNLGSKAAVKEPPEAKQRIREMLSNMKNIYES